MNKSNRRNTKSYWTYAVFKKVLFSAYKKYYLPPFIIVFIISLAACNDFLDEIRPFRAYKMSSQSMMPTLIQGDRVIVDHTYYRNRSPERGDVIIFEYPSDSAQDMVKRVIAVEGDVIRGQNKNIYLNDQLVREPYTQHTSTETIEKIDNFGPINVPEGTLFVMGDNRDQSLDSRMFGLLPLEKVKGKVLHIYWSGRLSRIGTRFK